MGLPTFCKESAVGEELSHAPVHVLPLLHHAPALLDHLLDHAVAVEAVGDGGDGGADIPQDVLGHARVADARQLVGPPEPLPVAGQSVLGIWLVALHPTHAAAISKDLCC